MERRELGISSYLLLLAWALGIIGGFLLLFYIFFFISAPIEPPVEDEQDIQLLINLKEASASSTPTTTPAAPLIKVQ